MSTKKRKVFALGLGALSCLGLCCGIIFRPRPIPSPPPEFDQTKCEKPCWYGLQVGISTRQDIQNVLDTFPEDSSKIQIEIGEYQSGIQFIKIEFFDESYRYHPNGPSPVVSFDFEKDSDDVVDRIYISDMLIMGQALEVFGEPDGVISTSHPTIHPNYWKKDLHLYYPENGVSVSCYEGTTFSTSDRPPCYENSEVSLAFFDPEDYRDILEEQFGDADLALKYMQPYNGLSADYTMFVTTPIP